MQATIVICTRNRAEKLRKTLEAIATAKPAGQKLIVVDTSDPENQEAVKNTVIKHGGEFIHRDHKGLGASRNTALKAINTKYVAFLDDDCVPIQNWAEELINGFTDETIWAVTGRIISEDTTLLFDRVASQDFGTEKKTFTPHDIKLDIKEITAKCRCIFAGQLKGGAPAPYGIGNGGNVAFRVNRLRELGGFNEAFWRAAEDIEMFYRVLQNGGGINYQPTALAIHCHPHITTKQVARARQAYSLGTAAFMRGALNSRLAVLYTGRLLQLLIKYAQFRMTGKKELAVVYAADIRGWLQGFISGNPPLHNT